MQTKVILFIISAPRKLHSFLPKEDAKTTAEIRQETFKLDPGDDYLITYSLVRKIPQVKLSLRPFKRFVSSFSCAKAIRDLMKDNSSAVRWESFLPYSTIVNFIFSRLCCWRALMVALYPFFLSGRKLSTLNKFFIPRRRSIWMEEG